MCGISGVISLSENRVPDLPQALQAMNTLQAHRGPDGEGTWMHERRHVGLGHRRLSIIDLANGAQPMRHCSGNCIVFNGEIYNYLEIRKELGADNFQTTSDTEVILEAYDKWGEDCLSRLRGMFAFALWDEKKQRLFCARDRVGIKPFYYVRVDENLYFASEAKALLPFIPQIETDREGLKDYLYFQLCLDGKTLFKNVRELLPGHSLTVAEGEPRIKRYWDVQYEIDLQHSKMYFMERLRELMQETLALHLRSDVPVGAYVSGGLDSSLIAALARRQRGAPLNMFCGKFSCYSGYDESSYARLLASASDSKLHELDISLEDFTGNLEKVIYHLDYPVAGPGSFSQFMISGLACRSHKVLLGGQGGDEIFGGYARYLIAYFEQCIKGAIDGTLNNAEYVVTYESIIPNLNVLRQYKPLLQEFWRDGFFESMDRRYFRLVNRALTLGTEVRWAELGTYSPFETFKRYFEGSNVMRGSYFDKMTHFDFKTLLPGLMHAEDRVSMAHGLESRVPFLDHELIEFVATIPSRVKFENGTLKRLLRDTFSAELPLEIVQRTDKMGFPTPVTEWIEGGAKEFVRDILNSERALQRDYIDNSQVLEGLATDRKFGRKMWGLLSLELWQRQFHDRENDFKNLLKNKVTASTDQIQEVKLSPSLRHEQSAKRLSPYET